MFPAARRRKCPAPSTSGWRNVHKQEPTHGQTHPVPFHGRPCPGWRGRRHRPPLRLELNHAADRLCGGLGALGRVSGRAGLPDPVAADARGRLTGAMAWPGLTALRALGMAWTLPNTLLGLVLGMAGLALGARPHLDRGELALVFNHWPWGPGGAITFGNVILHTGSSLDVHCMTYAHRAGHCQQPE